MCFSSLKIQKQQKLLRKSKTTKLKLMQAQFDWAVTRLIQQLIYMKKKQDSVL